MGVFARSGDDCPMCEAVTRSKKRVGHMAVRGRYHRLPRVLEDDYIVDRRKPLGIGCSGGVYPAKGIRASWNYAVKSFKIGGKRGQELEDLIGEAEILLSMDHPHVVRLMDVYESAVELSFVMERMEGGELFDRIQKVERFSEPEAVEATLQMLRAVDYIHSEGVVHRDLKLENFMYDQKVTKDSKDFLKLIDFGFSKFTRDGEIFDDSLGTVMYVAPEVISRKYSGGSCDMWSLGVIVFCLLSGYMPFMGKGQDHCLRLIKKGRYRMKADKWDSVSENAKDFVRQLLVVDPQQRLSASQSLTHAWFHGHEELAHVPPTADRAIVNAFVKFAKASQMKQVCMKMMAWTLHADARRKLRDTFIHSSLTEAGVIKIVDLKSMLEESELQPRQYMSLFNLLDELDDDEDGELHYSDFLAAMMSAEPDIYDGALHRTFWHFTDDGLSITPTTLQNVVGDAVGKDEVREFFEQADSDKDGKINAHEFVTFLAHGCPEKARTRTRIETKRFAEASESRRSRATLKERTRSFWKVIGCLPGEKARSLPLIGSCFGSRSV